MKRIHTIRLLLIILFCCISYNVTLAQQSLLVNLGSNTCADPLSPAFSIVSNPFGSSSVLNNCDLKNQIPDYNNTFIAYNPKDNKIYVNDVRFSPNSRIWVLDVGLPNNIICPATIPVDPNFTPTYSVNNFEFDNSGNLWTLRNYNKTEGTCIMDQYDIMTGNILASKTLQFSAGNFPSDIGNGDLCILPNGRLFTTLGRDSSKFYEITNYNGGSGNATGTFLHTMPKNCFGIAYLNGKLEITGTNSTDSCYYFDYDIGSNILGGLKNFQNGLAPIDNTSISPVVGTTKRLVGATKLSNNSFELTYEIYLQNLGNVILNNINITEDLGKVFGAGNVSNVTANFIPGFNTPGLLLNSSYNGITITDLLAPNQQLANRTSPLENYFTKLEVTFTASNLTANQIYYNSAIATANISSDSGPINIIDSSNNGTPAVVDPNQNGIANELGENVPTPFSFGLVPVKFMYNYAVEKNRMAFLEWKVATPVINANKFIIEISKNGTTWQYAGEVVIDEPNQSNYQFTYPYSFSGNVFYRIKEIDKNGLSIYSTIMKLNNGTVTDFQIYPNPASNFIQIISSNNSSGKTSVELYDAVGRKLSRQIIVDRMIKINTTNLLEGVYMIKLLSNGNTQTQRIIVKH
ncbi:T9SS type A sorting domain-containing protein [Ferruginibacter lapsinanis]|uniref:T9SS type A sorting domain-containing protein n=1 Tax=Ferruginibacter lapsinanis TaxID=563172 RepID=UPI001E531D24|nr:T9SS type A sorting domain-containing protein [Ferruginibacter lapsinanis]UEG50524.1 T9SS type A sorting domain-containing protein [Ferruginibacter lapsinanis]